MFQGLTLIFNRKTSKDNGKLDLQARTRECSTNRIWIFPSQTADGFAQYLKQQDTTAGFDNE